MEGNLGAPGFNDKSAMTLEDLKAIPELDKALSRAYNLARNARFPKTASLIDSANEMLGYETMKKIGEINRGR